MIRRLITKETSNAHSNPAHTWGGGMRKALGKSPLIPRERHKRKGGGEEMQETHLIANYDIQCLHVHYLILSTVPGDIAHINLQFPGEGKPTVTQHQLHYRVGGYCSFERATASQRPGLFPCRPRWCDEGSWRSLPSSQPILTLCSSWSRGYEVGKPHRSWVRKGCYFRIQWQSLCL